LFFSVELFPQLDDEWLNDDVDVAYVEPIHSTNIGYIEEHFSGYTFSTYSYGDQVKRFIFETRLRYNELLFDHTTLNFEYRYQNSFFDTPVKNNSSNEKFNKTFSYDLQEFRELYVQQTINDFLSFKGGKQTIIWGQWSTFSPIDLLLPFDFAVIGPSFNKEQIKQPIEAYNLTFSPNDQWFTTLYYFPHFTLDNSSKESLDYAVSNGRTVIYPDPDKDEQLALRSLYVGDKTTYAITLFKGYEVIRNQFSEIDSYHFGQTFSTSNKYMFPQKYALALEAYQRLNDSDSLGIEILIQSRKVSFDNLNSDYFLLSNTKSTELQNYLDWVQNSNSGNFYATQYVLISSIGYEKFLSRHVLKLSVSYIHLINPDHTQKGFDYYDLLGVTDSLIDWTETYRFLGSLTYLYYLTEDQNQSLGMVLGFLGSGVGGSAFYGITFEESLTFGFGVEYIKYLSDLSFGTSDTGEQIVNVDEITYRSGLQYTF
tara:strand:+ start:561 stop:2009 length:1449 start_codon:yes stop_codon:yes gene_type:complete